MLQHSRQQSGPVLFGDHPSLAEALENPSSPRSHDTYTISADDFNKIVTLKQAKEELESHVAEMDAELSRVKAELAASKKANVEERRELQKEAFQAKDKAEELEREAKLLRAESVRLQARLQEKALEMKAVENERNGVRDQVQAGRHELNALRQSFRQQEELIKKLEAELNDAIEQRNKFSKKALETKSDCVCRLTPPENLSSAPATPAAIVQTANDTNVYIKLRESISTNKIRRLETELASARALNARQEEAIEAQRQALKRLEETVEDFVTAEQKFLNDTVSDHRDGLASYEPSKFIDACSKAEVVLRIARHEDSRVVSHTKSRTEKEMYTRGVLVFSALLFISYFLLSTR